MLNDMPIRQFTKEIYEMAHRHCADVLARLPAADVVEVRHGEWIMIDGMPHCGKCGLLPEHPTRYCPNCGARMDGGVNDA